MTASFASEPDPAAHSAPVRTLSTIERAFELARSGSCRSVAEIVMRLKQERHDSVEAHLAGQSIRRDLRRLCAEAAKAAAARA
jgi:hypothetical protein